MTDFRPGDRVKVEFEGEVTGPGIAYREVTTRYGAFNLPIEFLTKLAPKPQPGDVWRMASLGSTVPIFFQVYEGPDSLRGKNVDGSEDLAVAEIFWEDSELLFRLPTDQGGKLSEEEFATYMAAVQSCRTPRQPRVFHYGDPEPGPEVKKVRDVDGDTAARGSRPGWWHWIPSPTADNTIHWLWEDQHSRYFPMTEVIEGDDE